MIKFVRLVFIPTVLALTIAISIFIWISPNSNNEDVSSRLPDSIIENSSIAEQCVETLQEVSPYWTTAQARKCIDELNGYTDTKGKIIHPFR